MGDSRFFITADHAFGHAFGRDTSAFVAAAGGKVPRGRAASAQYRRPLLTAAGASRDTKGKVREDGRVMRLIV